MTGPTFFDTSFLLAGLIDLGQTTAMAHRVMNAIAERRISRVCTAWHCCLEFYSVATRLPPEFRLDPEIALQLIESEVLSRFRIQQLPPDFYDEFLRSAAREGTAGGRIYDSHIAEIALRSGAKVVVTDNRRHFTSLLRHEVRVLTTEEFGRELSLGK